MAELVLKVNDGANYEDGDILCCFNRRNIRSNYAQMICRLGTEPGDYNKDGLRIPGSLPDALRINTMQYKFQRVSETEVQRIAQADASQQLFGPPDIFVSEYITRRRRSKRHAIFGDVGSEYWYGGNTDYSLGAIIKVWAQIKRLTGQDIDDPGFNLAPLGNQDIRSHLAVRMQEVTDQEAAELVSPEYAVDENGDPILDDDGTPIIAKKRAFKADWRNPELLAELQVSTRNIEDVQFPVGKVIIVGREDLRQSKDQPVQPIRDKTEPNNIDKFNLKSRKMRKRPRPRPRPVPQRP